MGKEFSGLLYGDPSTTYFFDRTATNIISDPAIISQLRLQISSPTSNFKSNSRVIKIVCTTAIPARIKCDINNSPYGQMAYTITTAPKTSHSADITFPEGISGTKTIYFKAADAFGMIYDYVAIVNVSFDLAPIGADVNKLLRLRKFSKNGQIVRWDGRKKIA